jgi:Poly(A) polymerase catalytic subunit
MSESKEQRALEILKKSQKEIEAKQGEKLVSNPTIKEIVSIVEQFLVKKKLICYGGTAINNILPKKDQFYDMTREIPDYDFFSPKSLDDAKELADIFYSKGFSDVEAKSGMHTGTYKVFVNFIGVADITFIEPELFKSLMRETIEKNGILYAPVNFLRMSMYLELSRPDGDVSRWEKVYSRLMRFNKNYPLKGENCLKNAKESSLSPNIKEIEIFDLIRDEAISEKLVFFGGYACSLFSEHLKKSERPVLYSSMPSFDLLSEHAEKSASKIKKVLDKTGDFKSVIIEKREEFGEHISSHYELIVDGRTVAFIYEPSPGACHNYNVVKINGKDVHIATTDTILSFYLLFLYIDRPYYDRDRLLCMSQYIYDLQYDKLTKNEGIFKRFSKPCIGKQVTLKDIKDAKSHMFEKLKNKKGTREYEEWFLNYNPIEKHKHKALKGKAAVNFNEKLKSIDKHSPSYSKRKNTPVTTSPRKSSPRTLTTKSASPSPNPNASPSPSSSRRFTHSKRSSTTPNRNKKNVKKANHKTHKVRRKHYNRQNKYN